MRHALVLAAALACGVALSPESHAQSHHGGGHFAHGGGFHGGYGWAGPRFGYPRYYVNPFYYSPWWGVPYYSIPLYVRPPVEYIERYYVEPAPPPQPQYTEPQYTEPQYSYDERAQAQSAPPAPPAERAPRMERVTLSARELFGFDEATLRAPQPKLDAIASAMRRDPGIGNVTVTGYTDRIGSDSYNLKLSQRRAEAVKKYLVGKGVEADRLTAIGKGKADPIVQCNDTDRQKLIACLEPNRRVEVERITIERRVP
jgi:Outer membrane protein and related peptidoglycan-associated (lipo)proteins